MIFISYYSNFLIILKKQAKMIFLNILLRKVDFFNINMRTHIFFSKH